MRVLCCISIHVPPEENLSNGPDIQGGLDEDENLISLQSLVLRDRQLSPVVVVVVDDFGRGMQVDGNGIVCIR